MKFGRKFLALLLLLVGLVLVNYLAGVLPWRLDATADHIYTLSPGTKQLLAGIKDPLTLDLYFSRGTTGQMIQYKDYAERVREMLREYVRAAHGKITFNVIDPEPDTPEEEKATAAGIEPQTLPDSGESFYFGLVATQADQVKALPALDPNREQFLEYDLSELIYSVQQVDKKKLGLLTSLPLQGSPDMGMPGQQPQEGQYVVNEWTDTFDIVPVDSSATALPDQLDALALIHPENLTPQLKYAIDQFLLSGKPVFVAVDPSSQYFKRAGGQQAMMGGPQPNVSSDLPTLFGGWGIAYNPQKVVGDNDEALQAQSANGTSVHYPVWLGLDRSNVNTESPATAQLNALWFIEAGSVALKPGSDLHFTPLVQTGPQAGELDAMSLQFAQPDDIARQITPSGRKVVAALITGKFPTAFPDGPPKEAKAAEDKSKPPAPPAPAAPGLKASRGTSTLIVVADTDWLFDDYSLRKMNFLGQTAAEPLNDNLSFAANALDFLSGNQELLSIRGKGSSIRHFTVVHAMEARAGAKYREKLTALEAQLNQVQSKLTELQGKKTEGNRLVASPEMQKAIADFQKQDAQLRGERREIRLSLREGIDALENRLLWINLLATPLLVCAFGVWFYRSRKK
ncbi:MAG TPA: Gldg family protein [Opitutaceae bacterium]|nr:Gldg family protein [Opitutaceae bacterium]